MPEWLGKIIGKVRIEKLLARGGMAEVYLGTHLNLERPVAIKFLHGFMEEEPALLERFLQEARGVARLRHPNIVRLIDFDTINGHPFIVMEYVKGPTLAAYLRRLYEKKKRIPPNQVARLLTELCDALDYAHKQGVVHRDIKPANILLHSSREEITLDQTLPEDMQAVITDFGLMQVMNSASQTTSDFVSGTPAYMSPEQSWGVTDHRTDIYSMGVVLYEMLAGRVPFGEADSTLTVLHLQIHYTPPPIEGMPPAVQAVVNRALEKNPADRYQTSRELALDFLRAIGMHAQSAATEAFPVISPKPQPASQPTVSAKEQQSPYEVSGIAARREINKPDPTREKPSSKNIGKLAISIAYPMLLSKGFDSPFVLQYSFPQQREQALENIGEAFDNREINVQRQSGSVKLKQKVRVIFLSDSVDFSEPIPHMIGQDVNAFRVLGRPKADCEPGFHRILIAVADEASGLEIGSMTITTQIVDFAFDHISRPWLSRLASVVLGVGSLMLFVLGFLGQIDQTVGMISGTAAGTLAVFIYGSFYTLYQRLRRTSP